MSTLIQTLDNLISRYVRLNERNVCYTCAGYGNEAGHFIQRAIEKYRHDLINVHCQCHNCNVDKSGNLEVYEIALRVEYGDEIVNKMLADKKANVFFRYDEAHLKSEIKRFRKLLKEFE